MAIASAVSAQGRRLPDTLQIHCAILLGGYTHTWPSPRSFWDRPSPYRGHFWCQYRVKTCRHPPFISTSRNSRPRPIQASERVVGGSESLARHRRVVCDDSTLCLDKICEGSIPTCRTPPIWQSADPAHLHVLTCPTGNAGGC